MSACGDSIHPKALAVPLRIDMNNTGEYDEALTQIRDYDTCFAEFLKPPGNGQKIMQAILLREKRANGHEKRIQTSPSPPTF
jgi:hypothetical protein